MSFCSGGMTAVKNVWHKLTPVLEGALNTILSFTGKLKELEANPTVETILSLIPGEPAIQAAINVGIDKLSRIDAVIQNGDTTGKVTDFVAEVQKLDPAIQGKTWANLGALVLETVHPELSTTEAEALTILKIIVDKHESATAPNEGLTDPNEGHGHEPGGDGTGG